jgi:hypothetical protein
MPQVVSPMPKIPAILIAALITILARAPAVNAQGREADGQPKQFLLFDSDLDDAWISSHGKDYSLVWGASEKTVGSFSKTAPSTVLTRYLPSFRDSDLAHGIEWWQASHPGFVAYRCDGKTPAYFARRPNVPLDSSQQAVVDYQVAEIVSHVSSMRVVGFDNFQLKNRFGECGHLVDGKFMRTYSGAVDDPAYADHVVAWLESISKRLHAVGFKVMVNHIPDGKVVDGIDDVDMASPLTARLVAASDGMLDEKSQLVFGNQQVARDIMSLAQAYDSQKKPFLMLFQLFPRTRNQIRDATGAYLVMAGEHAALATSFYDRDYGSAPSLMGYERSVGRACGIAKESSGLLTRAYGQGVALFLLPGEKGRDLTVPPGFMDVDGSAIDHLHLEGGTATVLYRAANDGCVVGGPK